MLASRWTGDGWTVRSGPVGRLVAVDGIRGGRTWAVGTTPERSGYGRGLIVRWDGARWSLARRLNRTSELRDIVVTSGSDAWAVGRQGRNARPFVVRRHGGLVGGERPAGRRRLADRDRRHTPKPLDVPDALPRRGAVGGRRPSTRTTAADPQPEAPSALALGRPDSAKLRSGRWAGRTRASDLPSLRRRSAQP